MTTQWTALFSGQGQQFAGMGADLLAQEPRYQAVVQAASEALHLQLADPAVWDDPVNAPVAIVTLSLGVYQVLCQDLPLPQAGIGLSLGEYSALAASGMLSLADVFPLVQDRAAYMNEAGAKHPGVMAAVLRASATMVEEACAAATAAGTPVFPANFNTPAQTVIGGSAAGVTAVTQALKAQGVKRIVPLKMTVASHTPLMAEASMKLGQRLAHSHIQSAQFPVWSNTTQQPFTADTVTQTLTDQLVHPTHFGTCLKNAQPTTVIEVGPGTALTKFAAKTIPGMTAWHVDSMTTLNELRKNWSETNE
ncbi:ACP S-malonyltransferase [Schleiferilactobacillus perolens]|uniref:Malonyl CoA-acyl carrier protein transacylase n=1 Tax=Schleiferilactobacillus perolens DSM 12744 TaxID=1423792 RepID=A0A0R1MS57_9LACO|nr:ACP S-malonyltransferase [Schleiferilactobacillus perolens]KRL11117.1 (acyl-carrier-protein) S-malonyltransferase [Schleiferilactobacillus perolens DSM 12744]